ncbi:MAG: RluA family pseudouridine synthase [Bacilli bacterium]|nr:RluA family pseudouridine synthase [Bacilli bacterium]
MNKNDIKKKQSNKGLIDPNKTKTYLVYHETDLLTFLREKMPGQNQHNIRHMISNHQVAVGGAPTNQWFFKLYPEDEVTVSWTPIKKRERKDLPIIYEDEDIIAIDKPSGLLSVASDREKGRTAYRLVNDWMTQKNKNNRIFVVHRLDEDTSGVLIFAKNFETREALQNNWSETVTKRGYYAIVEGEDIENEGTLKNYLWQDDTFTVRITRNKDKGKLAITHFKKMISKGGYTLLDVNIDTGRKNQIRAQLGHIGHYVIGDDRYGEPSNPIKRLGLHAYELDFTNPLTGKKYSLKAEIPASFKKLFWVTHAEKREAIEKKKNGLMNKPAKKEKPRQERNSKPFGKKKH